MLTALAESIKADHGFNVESRSIRYLLEIMSEFDVTTRRAFLQFITGSPKLPIGGTYRTLASQHVLTGLYRIQGLEPPFDGRQKAARGSLDCGRLPAQRNDLRQLLEIARLQHERSHEGEVADVYTGGCWKFPFVIRCGSCRCTLELPFIK